MLRVKDNNAYEKPVHTVLALTQKPSTHKHWIRQQCDNAMLNFLENSNVRL